MLGQHFGRYRVQAKLGAGGMGEVYRAHDSHLGRDVALKVLPQTALPDDSARRHLLEEARAACCLNHANICVVYEAGEVGGEVYVAMEYVQGKTLQKMISGSALPSHKIIRYGRQLANALAHAHQHGIVHGDLKPANIIVTPQEQLKLLDFGLARRNLFSEPDQTTQSTGILGTGRTGWTLAYAAPELLHGSAANARTDIWCLGIVLYEMAVGRRPFDGNTTYQLTSNILNQSCPTLPASAPGGLNIIVQRCLEKQPGQRYQRATEVVAALETISETPTTRDDRSTSGAQLPKRRLLFTGFILVLLAAAALTLDLSKWSKPQINASVAVLPLEDLSVDGGQDYFSDGLTDELITELGSISALKVISRTSVMRYKGARQSVPEIARQLNVEAVVQGSVLRAGDRIRINAQLTDAKTDHILWTHSYERDLQDIIRLQGEVAFAIASQVRAKLTPQEQAHLSRTARVDPEAYQLYLKGRYFWDQRTPQGFQQALELFRQSLKTDPTYAQAYCGLADTYVLQQDYGLIGYEEARSAGRAAALRAVELDSRLADAHVSLAGILHDYDRDWLASEREYKLAIDLNPSNATAHQWYGSLLSTLGRHRDAISEEALATELAPTSARVMVDLGYAYFHAREYDNAAQQGQKALKLDPGLAAVHELLGRVYLSKKLGQKAIAEFEKAAAITHNSRADQALLAYAYAKSGRKELAAKIATELSSLPTSQAPFYHIAMIYVALGEKQVAMKALERSFASERGKWLPLIGVEEAFDPLRAEPRFQAVIKRLQLGP